LSQRRQGFFPENSSEKIYDHRLDPTRPHLTLTVAIYGRASFLAVPFLVWSRGLDDYLQLIFCRRLLSEESGGHFRARFVNLEGVTFKMHNDLNP
jgi:hypothetical protein